MQTRNTLLILCAWVLIDLGLTWLGIWKLNSLSYILLGYSIVGLSVGMIAALFRIVYHSLGKPTRAKIQDKSETVLIYIIVGIGAIANLGTLYVACRLLPTGLLSGLLAAGFAYFYDKIPYSHVWSPSVRELYPHKQWRIERALLKSLHSLRIIPTSRVANRTTLPIEIWSLILADAIQIPYFFDTACSPETFNLFVSKQAYGPSPSERNRTEAQIRNISAVCKTWKYIINRRAICWLNSRVLPSNYDRNWTRVDLELENMPAQEPAGRCRAFLNSVILTPERIVSLNTMVLYQHRYTFDPSTPQFFEDRIVPHSQTLFNVQSLIFDAKLPITQQFLRNIETSFSHLFFLRLEGYFQSEVGNLTLDQLEILYLNVEPPDSFTWWFPQLRHLVLGDEIFKTEQFHLGLIPAPPEKLLSLLLLSATQHPVLQADCSFWSQMSSLRFLGAPIAAIEVAENAPINHPLAHFCLPEAHIEWRILSTPFDPILQRERIIRIANALPNLKFLTMPLGDEGEQASHYSREWREIFRTHRLRDIIWINEYGESIDGLRRARAKVERGMILALSALYNSMVGIFLLRLHILSDDNVLYFLPGFFLGWLFLIFLYWLWTVYDR